MSAYVPGPGGEWERIDPREAGFVPERLESIAAFHAAHESEWPRSMYHPNGEYVGTAYIDEKPPVNTVIGPVAERGAPAGMILKGGRIVTQWGDVARPDMTFSIAKSFLGVIAGLAIERGVIASLDERLSERGDDPEGFASAHNRGITWRHLLQQTSEWEGTLWDKPDAVDRNRQAGPGANNAAKGDDRTLQPPGTHFEYNDVRVNRLSLSLLQALRQPLPEVLDDAIMQPIGAEGWTWRGYHNSTVEIDGKPMESVSGGGHWGGGLFIPTMVLARFGLLIQRRGIWGDRRLLPESWITQMLAPSGANPVYGFMWWLNTDGKLYPSASPRSVFCLGAGMNVIWICPEEDLLMVARWIHKEHVDGLIAAVNAARA